MDIKHTNETIQSKFHKAGYTGKDIIFAVIDTGVSSVSYLAGRVVAGNQTGLDPVNPHGTYVASLLIGVCPSAYVRSWNVFPDGTGSVDNVIKALRDVLRQAKSDTAKQYVVNLSILSTVSDEQKAQYEQAIKDLVAYNVPVFCAAGNDGQEVLNKYPSCFHDPICISALTQDGAKARFSTWHNEVDFAEWGVSLTVLDTTGSTTLESGTSLSCPIAASKAGLLCDCFKQTYKRWPTEPEVFEMMQAMATDLGKSGFDPYFGYGFVEPSMTYQMKQTEDKSGMFDYVKNLGLPWPNGRSKRSKTDHIQIHHTVGNYATEAKWKALHQKRIDKDGYLGIEYSYGICPDGTIFEGRGLEYKHGAVKNSLTQNAQGIGAADRSVSITLIGDMRESDLPTAAQYASAIQLCKDLMVYYNLPVSAVLGHNEIPLEKGGPYPTLCPCIDMAAFRADIQAESGFNKDVPTNTVPTPQAPSYPVLVAYSGSSSVNVRSGAGTNYPVVGKFSAKENAILLAETADDDWDEIVLYEQNPMVRGWCKGTWTKKV